MLVCIRILCFDLNNGHMTLADPEGAQTGGTVGARHLPPPPFGVPKTKIYIFGPKYAQE